MPALAPFPSTDTFRPATPPGPLVRPRPDGVAEIPLREIATAAAPAPILRPRAAAEVAPRPDPRAAGFGFVWLVGLIALVAGAKPILFDTIDPDCFWHLRVAGQLKTDGIGPLVDRLSFASIQTPWTPYSWLAELGMKAVWDAGGWRAAVGAQAILQAAFVAVVALGCRAARAAATARCRFLPGPGEGGCSAAAGSRLAAVVATAFVTYLSLPYLSFRPVAAALLLLALSAWLLVRDRAAGERTWGVWAVVPLTALMTNLHLYAVFVPVWVAALAGGAVWERLLIALPAEHPEADRRIARYVVLFLASGLACMATPMFVGVVTTALHYQYADPMVASGYLSEMRPFFFGGTLGTIAGGLAAAALLLLAIHFRRLRPGEFLWLAGSIFILSRMGRFAPVFALAVGPMLAVALPRLSDRVLARPPVWVAVAAVLALGLNHLARAFPRADRPLDEWVNRHGPDALGYPCAAANYVAAHVEPKAGRLVSEFTWGGYLEWRLGDRYQLFLDGRTQLFTPDFWKATYLAAPADRQQFLAGVRADAAVVPAAGSVFRGPLVRLGWTPVYRDERAEVLIPPAEAAKGTGNEPWSVVTALLPG